MSRGAARPDAPARSAHCAHIDDPERRIGREAAVLAVPVRGADPLDRVAGVSLVLRAVLTLQKVGVARVVVVTDSAPLAAGLNADPRVHIPVEAAEVTLAPGPPRDGSSLSGPCLAPLQGRFRAPFVVARIDTLVDPTIYDELLAAHPGETLAAVAFAGDRAVGPLLATEAVIAALGEEPLDEGLARLDREKRITRVDVGSRWAVRVTDGPGRRRAVHELFEACRKPVDGYVARYLNRHVSIFVSKLLVDTPVSPNNLSVVTFLLGVAAAVSAARGGWAATAAAGVLLQLNSILDGCDGELARVRFQHSRLGQWLDTVSDDLSNILFYGGLALGARGLTHGAMLSSAGWIAVVAAVATALVNYSELIQLGSGDLYAIEWGFDKRRPSGLRGTIVIFCRYLAKKDAAVLIFCVLSLAGVLPFILPLIAIGQVVGFIVVVGRRLSRGLAVSRG